MIIEYENWYTRHQDIIREAGMKETVGGIIGAIVLILYGLTLQDASQRMQVPEQEVVSAMEDEAAVEKARRIMKKETQREKMPEDAPPTDEMIITKNIMARTIYAEGQSESEEGKRAIATVIYNRGRGNPNTIVKVIQSPKQFSCWNSADSNDWTNMKQGKGNSWEESQKIAQEMIDGTFSPIAAYDHYYNPKKANPYWAYKDKAKTILRPYITIGNHRFFILGSWNI